jgi:hypothetical protein
MSYTYPQYSTGFQLQMPTPEAQQFNELLQLRGTPATIINRTQTGTNTYGNHNTMNEMLIENRKKT